MVVAVIVIVILILVITHNVSGLVGDGVLIGIGWFVGARMVRFGGRESEFCWSDSSSPCKAT